MKFNKIMAGFISASLFCLMFAAVSFAGDDNKEIKHHVDFSDNFYVNNTMVKKGRYEVKFDPATNQISILDGNKVLASASASVEMLDKKSEFTTQDFMTTDKGMVLKSVKFQGDKRQIMILSPNGSADQE